MFEKVKERVELNIENYKKEIKNLEELLNKEIIKLELLDELIKEVETNKEEELESPVEVVEVENL